MRLSEILKEQSPEKERCPTCDGLGKEFVGDELLVFDCPDCKGVGYFDQKEELEEHGDKWERDSEGKGIGWGFKDDEREARKYGHRTGDRSGPGSKLLTPDEAAEMYSGSEDELEERKVTKTLAGRKQTPSRQLAMKKKKTSPNQGKKPVELDKAAKSMKDLSNELLKGEYATTRKFGQD